MWHKNDRAKKKRSEYKHKLSECAVALAVVVTTSQIFTVQICIWYFSQTASFLLRYSLVVTLPATEWFGWVKCKLQFEIRQNPYTQQNADCVASFRHIIDHINRADRYNFFILPLNVLCVSTESRWNRIV